MCQHAVVHCNLATFSDQGNEIKLVVIRWNSVENWPEIGFPVRNLLDFMEKRRILR